MVDNRLHGDAHSRQKEVHAVCAHKQLLVNLLTPHGAVGGLLGSLTNGHTTF